MTAAEHSDGWNEETSAPLQPTQPAASAAKPSAKLTPTPHPLSGSPTKAVASGAAYAPEVAALATSALAVAASLGVAAAIGSAAVSVLAPGLPQLLGVVGGIVQVVVRLCATARRLRGRRCRRALDRVPGAARYERRRRCRR